MPAFDYVALDEKGRQKKGTVEGDSARQVRQQLREKNLTPLSVDATAEKSKASAGSLFDRNTISTADLALITRQLATLVAAGLPIEEALRAVSKQADKPKLASIMLAVRAKVVEGHTLAQSMAEFPRAFSNLYRSTVAAGEHSGHLDLVLEQLADYTETSHDTAKKVQGALVYPIILTLLSIVIVVGLVRFIIPKMTKVFENSGQELPFVTKALVDLSQFFEDWGLLVLLLLVGIGVGIYRALQNERVRFRYHEYLLRMPFVSKFSRGFNAARVASTLSILSSSGVQLVEALKIAGEVSTNLCIRECVLDASVSLREGASLHKSLDQSGQFPPMLIQMIASGENSGELDAMLARAARNQERELESLINTMIGLFEPLMMVFMGLIVLTIVSSVMMPMLSMNELVG